MSLRLLCPTSPRSGIIMVKGTDNIRAKGAIGSSGGVTTVKIEFDDGSSTFTEVTEPAPGSPFLVLTSLFRRR